MSVVQFPWTEGIFTSNPGLCVEEDNKVLLFSPYKIKDLVLKNRIVVPPMCQYSSNDGFMNSYHMAHYGSFALGGVGLIIVEATGVVPEGRISPYDVGIWKDEHIEELKKVVDFCHSTSTPIGIQIGHAGRKACTSPSWLKGNHGTIKEDYPDWDIVGPSPISFDGLLPTPREATKDDIKYIIKSFADAAVRADKAGFDVLEIHGAHGYLISTFLSPISNQRTDEYGGSFENRTRLLVEIVDEVSKVWPKNKPFLVRVSCDEYVEGGWNSDDTVKLAKILHEHGVDAIDCSSGGISSHQQIPNNNVEGYQVKFADDVKNKGNVPSIAVGLITTPSYAEKVLQEGKADLIEVGRGILDIPTWPFLAAKELDVKILRPVQYRWVGHLKK